MPTAKKTSGPPLKKISNGTPNRMNISSSKSALESKVELKPQIPNSTPPTVQLPPRSKLNLTEEMKKKAALWAEEGIEEVHFTFECMEKQRCMIRDEEIAKHVALIRNCQMDIPFPRFSASCSLDLSSTWKPPGDVPKLDVVKDLSDDDAECENEGLHSDGLDEVLGCIDYFAINSPPRCIEGWPKVKEWTEIE